MATFHYVARDRDGGRVTGVLSAEAQHEVVEQLAGRHLFPVRISQRRSRSPLGRSLGGSTRIGPKQLTRLFNQMSDLLRAGVPILRALEVVERQSTHAGVADVVRRIRADVADGSSLGDAMAKHPRVFDDLHLSMVRAGEKGAFLEEVLRRITTFMDHQQELKARVVGSLAYPVFLLCFGTVAVSGLVVFAVPEFKQLFDQMPSLPAPTVALLGLSDVVRHYGYYILGGLAIVGVVLWQAARTPQGQLAVDRLKLRLPVLGPILRDLAISRFARILGTLLHNGIAILTALRIAKDSTGNKVLSEAIDRAADNVKSGEVLADPLAESGHFPPEIIEIIAIGEQSNNLEQVLVDIADTQETRTARRIELMVRMLEPVMLVVMAGLTLLVMAALLLPVFKMSSIMQR